MNPTINQPSASTPAAKAASKTLGDASFQGLQLLQELVKRRKRQRISQTTIAARMGTSQSAVARIETGEIDIRMSTLDRYAAAIGQKIVFRIVRLPRSGKAAKSNIAKDGRPETSANQAAGRPQMEAGDDVAAGGRFELPAS